MAFARTEAVPPVEPQVKYILELSESEADVLLAVLGRFRAGGLTSSTFNALAAVRNRSWLDRSQYNVTDARNSSVGTLYVRKD